MFPDNLVGQVYYSVKIQNKQKNKNDNSTIFEKPTEIKMAIKNGDKFKVLILRIFFTSLSLTILQAHLQACNSPRCLLANTLHV